MNEVRNIIAEAESIDVVVIPTLADRVEERMRQEWPGVHFFPQRGTTRIPDIRPGGATDCFLHLMHRIITEETTR